ncbi:MAG TPA: serine/threonine-protein kinase [Kofleriaceae bacterium]|nr:serine/threonine-protein kinase [Kofleriaceae bacterium]
MRSLQGEVVGNYRITEQVGTGGMGIVYRAEHILLGKRAAVKVLLPERTQSREIVDRFFNEAKAASLIDDPGIVDIFDFGLLPNGQAYIVMELLEGETLGDRLKRQRYLTPTHAVSVARHIAGTLGAAHANGIIHRDLKPDNVFLVRDPAMPRGERAKLLDFGIAKLAATTGMDPADMVKTETGRLMGTPYYMSPEQCRGAGRVDLRTDVYSLGCLMYQTLTGRPPFVLEGAGEILAAHIHLPPAPLRAHEPSVPQALENVVLCMLEKDPAKRYQSMSDVVDALNEVVPQFAGEEEPEPSLAPSDRFRTGSKRRISHPPPMTEGAAVTTTLTTTSGEMRLERARTVPRGGDGRRRRPWAIGLAVAVVAAGGGTLAWKQYGAMQASADGAAEDEPDRPVRTAAAPATKPVPAATVEPVVRALDGDKPPGPGEVSLVLASEPDGATVYRESDGVRLGTTPIEFRVQRGGGQAVFILRRTGYHSETVTLPVAEDQRKVVQLREKARRAPATPPPSTPAPDGDDDGDAPTPGADGDGDDAAKPAPPRDKDGAINPFHDFLPTHQP